MKIRYLFEYALRDGRYVLAGIWVHGPRGGLDVDFRFLPGFEDREYEAHVVTNQIVDEGVKNLPGSFLEWLRYSLSPCDGTRTAPVTTLEHPTLNACMAAVLSRQALKESIAAKVANSKRESK